MIFRLHPLALACLAVSASSLAAPLELQETVITAKGYQAATQDIPQAIEVLQAQPTETAAAAGSLFRGKPGLAVHSDGAWGQNPVLRGMKKESTVLMVDGVRVNSAQPQGSLASFLDLGLLERAEVVKGPSSVLYGSGAMGGVVNLITPEARFTEQAQQGGRFGLSASSVDEGFNGAVLLRDSSSDHALVLGAAGRKVNDYDSPSGTEEHTGYSSDSLLLKYKQRLSDDVNVSLNIQRHTDRDVWYPGSTRSAPSALIGQTTIHSPEQRRELYQLGLENRLGEGTLNTEVYRQEVYREIRAYSSTLDRNQVRNDVSFITHGLRTSYLVPIGSHLLTVGGEGWKMTGDPERHMHNNPPLFNNDQRNDPFKDGEVSSYGLFVQDEFELGRTAIVAGARLDRVSGDAKQKGATHRQQRQQPVLVIRRHPSADRYPQPLRQRRPGLPCPRPARTLRGCGARRRLLPHRQSKARPRALHQFRSRSQGPRQRLRLPSGGLPHPHRRLYRWPCDQRAATKRSAGQTYREP